MDHLDKLTLERFCVDDLPAAHRASVQAHLDGCMVCTAFISETRAYVTADLQTHPSAAFVARLPKAQTAMWPRLVPILVAASVAAVVLKMSVKPATQDTTFKGAAVSVHRYRADASTVLSTGGRVRVGDRVEVRAVALRDASFTFVPDHGAPVPLSPSFHADESTAWFAMDAPCTPGWVVVHSAAQPDSRLRLECED